MGGCRKFFLVVCEAVLISAVVTEARVAFLLLAGGLPAQALAVGGGMGLGCFLIVTGARSASITERLEPFGGITRTLVRLSMLLWLLLLPISLILCAYVLYLLGDDRLDNGGRDRYFAVACAVALLGLWGVIRMPMHIRAYYPLLFSCRPRDKRTSRKDW